MTVLQDFWEGEGFRRTPRRYWLWRIIFSGSRPSADWSSRTKRAGCCSWVWSPIPKLCCFLRLLFLLCLSRTHFHLTRWIHRFQSLFPPVLQQEARLQPRGPVVWLALIVFYQGNYRWRWLPCDKCFCDRVVQQSQSSSNPAGKLFPFLRWEEFLADLWGR